MGLVRLARHDRWIPLGLLFLTCLLRLPSLWIPILDVDETQFIGFAQVLLDGGRPYIDSLDTKPPLIYLWVAGALSVFKGSPFLAIHLATILWVWLTGLLLYRLGSGVGSRQEGLMAALFYVAFSAGFVPKWISMSITQIMNLPLIAAMLFFYLATGTEKKKEIFYYLLSGIFISLAFNLKYQGGIQLPIVFFSLFYMAFLKRRLFGAFLGGCWIGLGFLLGVAAVWGSLALLGVWPDFWQWSVLGSFQYIESGRNSVWWALAIHGGSFLIAMAPLFYLAVSSFPVSKTPSPLVGEGRGEGEMGTRGIFFARKSLWLWFALTLVPVSTGGRFYHHYFLQLLPPLCLLAAFGAASRFESGKWRKGAWVFAAVFVLIPVGSRFFFAPLSRALGEETFATQALAGEALREMAAAEPETATLFVWGFATPIYTYSGLKPASRFLWTDLLSGRFPGPRHLQERERSAGLPIAWRAFWEDMEKRPPRYVVDTAPAGIHDYGAYPIRAYPDLARWIEQNFSLCREVEAIKIYCRNARVPGTGER